MSNSKKIAVFMHDFRGGGAERVSVRLCNGLIEQYNAEVIIFVIDNKGPMLSELNSKIQIKELNCNRMAFAFWELAKHIKKLQPDLVISHMTHANVTACLAAIIGRFTNKLVVVEHNQMQKNLGVINKRTVKIAYHLTKLLYNVPKKIIAVSTGVKQSTIDFTKVKSNKVSVIYNPVVNDELINFTPQVKENLHPFYRENVPVFICVGSLTKQKNFSLFLKSLKRVTEKTNVKAIILGEGSERAGLESLVKQLSLQDVVDMPGFVKNPYDYIANSHAFVLSSSWEGLPTVIIEAIALNTNVISTKCPSGPEEILNDGEFGLLVNVDDEAGLAEAMINSLSPKPYNLQERAEDFSVDKSVTNYYTLIEDA